MGLITYIFRRSKIEKSTIIFLVYVSVLLLLPLNDGKAECTESGADSNVQIDSVQEEFKRRKKNLLAGTSVGYKVVSLGEKLRIAIWYPTKSKTEQYVYKIGQSDVTSNLAFNGLIEDGCFPLVFYAHGAVGCGLSSFFLTEAIARKGYVVAAPDFSDEVYASRIDEYVPTSKERTKEIWNYLYSLRDNGLCSNAKLGRSKFGYRPKELKSSMDYLLKLNNDPGSIFYRHLDTENVGIVGHSFGAWTAALVSGAEPDYAQDGVRALVYLSGPSNKNVFSVDSKNDLGKIHCPVMFQYGAKEKLFSERHDDKNLFSKANVPKVLACIADCNHFTFSCGSGKQFSTASDYIFRSNPRTVICDLVIAFLDRYLKSNSKSSPYIEVKTSGVDILKSELLDSKVQDNERSRN